MGQIPVGWDGTGTDTSGMGQTGTEKNIFSWDGMGLGHKFKKNVGWDGTRSDFLAYFVDWIMLVFDWLTEKFENKLTPGRVQKFGQTKKRRQCFKKSPNYIFNY